MPFKIQKLKAKRIPAPADVPNLAENPICLQLSMPEREWKGFVQTLQRNNLNGTAAIISDALWKPEVNKQKVLARFQQCALSWTPEDMDEWLERDDLEEGEDHPGMSGWNKDEVALFDKLMRAIRK